MTKKESRPVVADVYIPSRKTLTTLGIVALAGATFFGGYAIGNYNGKNEGREQERQEIMENFEMRRDDVLQDARLIGFDWISGRKSPITQDEILKESACIGYTLNFLEPGYDAKKNGGQKVK